MTHRTSPTSSSATPTRPATHRPRTLRGFLRPYRGSLSLASGFILVETLLDLARPWPLKVAVDNAIGGQPLGGPLGVLDGLGPGWRRWPRWRGSGWWGSRRWSGTW